MIVYAGNGTLGDLLWEKSHDEQVRMIIIICLCRKIKWDGGFQFVGEES
jgi:hypothetical protein